jgi:hypothetical protein
VDSGAIGDGGKSHRRDALFQGQGLRGFDQRARSLTLVLD